MNSEREYCDVLNAMVTAGGVSDDKINAAEKVLGVTFPPPYRDFLSKYGAGMGTGVRLAGICEESNEEEPPMWESVVLTTQQVRRVSRGAIPNHLIPVSGDGQDTTFYIDTTSEAARVVAYGPGVDGEMVAASFQEFVVKASRDEL